MLEAFILEAFGNGSSHVTTGGETGDLTNNAITWARICGGYASGGQCGNAMERRHW
jgi:hypothetical protein